MDKIFCDICGIEFNDFTEMEGHRNLAHERDPLGIGSDYIDVEDPSDKLPFTKIIKEKDF